MRNSERKKPIIKKSKYPTITENLGYLNSVYCPKCGKHLFSYYDKDIEPNRADGYIFRIFHKWNFCSECGLWLDLDRWKDMNDTSEDVNNLFFNNKNDEVKFED